MRRRDIYDRDGGEVYLTRWWILGSEESRYALMLHKMHRPDNDECHHDHPWNFFTLILWGGYIEEITTLAKDRWHDTTPTIFVRRLHNRIGRIRYRSAEHTHRIARLPNGPCYTLVLRLKKRRHWGFHTVRGWIPWRRFIEQRGAINWCGGLIKRIASRT